MTPDSNSSLVYDAKHNRAWLKIDRATRAALDAADGEIVLVRLDDAEVLGVLVARRVWLVVDDGGLDVAAVQAVTARRRRRA